MADFLTTRWSLVAKATDLDDEGHRALSRLCEIYWPPLFAYVLRTGLDREEARDVTQDFFSDLLEKGWLERATIDRGRFRSFLLTALKRHIMDHHRAKSVQKRRGERQVFTIDQRQFAAEEAQEAALISAKLSPEAAYDLRWALTVLSQAMERLRRETAAAGREEWFEVMQPFLAEQVSGGDYTAPAAQLGISPNAFAQTVRRLRLSYRQAVRDEIAETMSDESQIDEEMAVLIEILRHQSR